MLRKIVILELQYLFARFDHLDHYLDQNTGADDRRWLHHAYRSLSLLSFITILHPSSVVFAVYHIEALEFKALLSPLKWIQQIKKVAGVSYPG